MTMPTPVTLSPINDHSFPEEPGWVRRQVVAADHHYAYVAIFHGGQPGDEHASSHAGELVLLNRDGLTEHHRVPVGWQPRAIAIDAHHERVYVVNYGQDSYSLSVFDRARLRSRAPDALLAEIPIGPVPHDVVADPVRGLAYVVNVFADKLHVIDGVAAVELADQAVPLPAHPVAASYEPAGDRIYVTVSHQTASGSVNAVVVVDAASRQVGERLDLPAYSYPTRPAALRPTVPAYDPTQQARHQHVLVGVTGHHLLGVTPGVVRTEFVAGQPPRHHGTVATGAPVFALAADPALGHVHAVSGLMLRVLDGATGQVLAAYQHTEPLSGVAVSPADSRIYATTAATGEVLEFTPQLWPPGPLRLPVAAEVTVAKGPDHRMYGFVVDESRQVQVSAWTEEADWSAWVPLGGSFPPGAPLAAVSTQAGSWQVFGVDDNGQLLLHSGAFSTPDPAGWVLLPGQDTLDIPPGAFLTAISWAAGQWLVFTIAGTGEVYSAGTGGGEPTGAMLGGEFHPGAPIAAVTRKPNHWDLFAVGVDGRMRTMWKGSDQNLPSPWGIIGQPEVGFGPDSRIVATGRKTDHLDVFAVGPDGAVWTIWWGGGWKDWGSLGGQFDPAQPIAAVARNPQALDVFVLDGDGQIRTKWWRDGWADQWHPVGAARWGATAGRIAAVTRAEDWMNVFWPTLDGNVHTMWWNQVPGKWSLQYDIDRVIPTPMRRVWKRIQPGDKIWGTMESRVWQDGSYELRGRVHDAGLDPYDYAMQATLRSHSGLFAVSSYHAGDVDGDFPPGGDNDDWWADLGINGLIVPAFQTGDYDHPELVLDLKYKNTGLGGFLGDLAGLLLEWLLDQAVFGPAGAAAALVGEVLERVIEQMAPGRGELAGLVYKYGQALIANPYGLVPAIIDDVVEGELSDLLVGLRELTAEERAFARKVFNNPDTPKQDTLPLDRIRLTRMKHPFNGKPYTIPLLSGIILINLGKQAHENPLGPAPNNPHPGQLFVHELVHAWQIEHAFSVPVFSGIAVGEHIWHGLGITPDPYDEPQTDDGRTWSQFGVEEQAELVEKWYTLYRQDLGSQAAVSDWRFRFVRDHIRLGRT